MKLFLRHPIWWIREFKRLNPELIRAALASVGLALVVVTLSEVCQ